MTEIGPRRKCYKCGNYKSKCLKQPGCDFHVNTNTCVDCGKPSVTLVCNECYTRAPEPSRFSIGGTYISYSYTRNAPDEFVQTKWNNLQPRRRERLEEC